MISIPVNADNRALAAAVNGRIRAEGVMLAARAAMWRLGAVGVLMLLAGGGVGAALYGYSYVNDSRTSYERMAAAFAGALDHANLGHVRLDIPDAAIKLDPNATVRLEPGATVRLDPASRAGLSDTPRPSERQLAGDGAPAGAKRVVNYVVFKTVAFGAGVVETGWTFASSDQDRPIGQFCHYRQLMNDGTQSSIEIAENGHGISNMLKQRFDLDVRIVAASCTWFDGQPTAT